MLEEEYLKLYELATRIADLMENGKPFTEQLDEPCIQTYFMLCSKDKSLSNMILEIVKRRREEIHGKRNGR